MCERPDCLGRFFGLLGDFRSRALDVVLCFLDLDKMTRQTPPTAAQKMARTRRVSARVKPAAALRPNIFAMSMFPPSYVPMFPGLNTPSKIDQLGQSFDCKRGEEANLGAHEPQDQIDFQESPHRGMLDSDAKLPQNAPRCVVIKVKQLVLHGMNQ